ncbi:MAG TPA: shikimate dehydrogenase [Anaerolineales bacterium]
MDHPAYTLGILGYPLGHSLSQRMYTAALRELDLEGEFLLFEIPPLPAGQNEVNNLFGELRQGKVDGICITIPHKQSVLPRVDELTPAAHVIGAANVVYRRKGRLVGDNTDAPGFLADLQDFLKRAGIQSVNQGSNALVLGAGGAARAVVYALLGAGWQVTVAARRSEQSRELVNHFQRSLASPKLQSADLASTPDLATPFSLLVNTTPSGMFPHATDSPWPAGVPFPSGSALYDVIYNPLDTALMQAARQAGLPVRNGLGMLVEQGKLIFERWTGKAAPGEVMRRAVESYFTPNLTEEKS